MDENTNLNEGGSIPVRVAVRIRPMVENEILKGSTDTISVVPGTGQVCAGKDKSYTFDFAYDELSTQEEIYSSCIQSLVQGFFQGYNATVFAYGQTGSGKTYTMGTSDDYNSLGENQVGIIPRVVNDIFSRIEADKSLHPNKNIRIETSFLEIHKEIIHDLFAPDPTQTNLTIREGSDGDITVPGLTTISIGSVEEFLYEMHKGSIHRSTASTNMNEQSSRSHAICTIIIHIEDDENEEGSVSAKFHLVDLAGSESVKKTGAEGNTFKEGISINCGLLALGNVISALCDERNNNNNNNGNNGNNHIPYRVSKLTRLLQDSLGGNSRTVMIACVSPADINYSETLNTLRYADRARQIKNKPIINKESDSAEATRLRQKVKELQYELAVIKNGGNINNNRKMNNNNNNNNNNREIIDTMKLAIATLEQKSKVAETELCMLRKTNQRLKIENSQLKQDTFEINKERDEIMLLLQKNNIPFDISGVSDEISVVEARLKEIEELKSEIIMLRSNATSNINLDDDDDMDIDIDEEMDNELLLNNNGGDDDPENPSNIDPTIESRSQFKELTERLNEKIKALQQTTSQCESIENIKEKNKEAIRKIEQLTKEKKDLMLKIEQLKQKSEGKESLQRHLMKLKELESQIKEYEKKERYYKQLEIKRMRDANTIQKLEREIQEIKQQRVNLQKQIKEESKKWREDIKKYEKQIVQMKKEERKQQIQNMKSQNMAQKVQSKLERQLQERDTKISKLLLQINNRNQVRSMNDAMKKKIDFKWLKNGYDVLIKRESDTIQLEKAKNSKKALLVQKKYVMRNNPPQEVFNKLQNINDEIIYYESEIKELNERLNENNKFDRKKLWDNNLHSLQDSIRALDYLLDIAVQSGVNTINLADQIEELKKIQKSSNEEFVQNNELLNCMLSIHENGVGDDLNKSTEVMIPLIQNQLNVYAEKVKILSNENSNLKERMNCLINKTDDNNNNNIKSVKTPLFQKIRNINNDNNNNNNEEDIEVDTPTILRVANELNDDDLGDLNVDDDDDDINNNNNVEDDDEEDEYEDDDDEYINNNNNNNQTSNKEKQKKKQKKNEKKDEIDILLTGKGCYCCDTSTCGTNRCFCFKFNRKCGEDCSCNDVKCKNREKENIAPEIKIENYLRECEKKNDVKMTFRQPSKSFTQPKTNRKSITSVLTQRKLSNHNTTANVNDNSCPRGLIEQINSYVDKVASKRENKLPPVDEVEEEENRRNSAKRKSDEGDDEKKAVPKKYYIALFCLIANGADSFEYSYNSVNYIKGNSISENTPKNSAEGIYTVTPSLIKGLTLDKTTGAISGIPEVKFRGSFTIKYTNPIDNKTMTSIVQMNVWEVPTKITCGVTKLMNQLSIDISLTCKVNTEVNSFTISPQVDGVSISDKGILVFSNYKIKGDVTLNITASNEAGNAVTTIITSIPETPIFSNGLSTIITSLNKYKCGEEIADKPYPIRSFWADIEGFTSKQKSSNVYKISNKCETGFNSYYFRYEFTSYLNISKEEEEYTFYYNLDQQKAQFYFDDEIFMDLTDNCYIWSDETSQVKSIKLSKGLHKVYINSNATDLDEEGNTVGTLRFEIHYSSESDTSKRQIPFVYPNDSFKPVYNLKFTTTVHYLLVGMEIIIDFSLTESMKTNRICKTTKPLPEGLAIENNRIAGKVFEVQPLTDYEFYCYNEYSITNYVTISLSITKNFHQGLVGYYMKPDDFDTDCYTTYEPFDYNVNLQIIRIDKNINHESITTDKVWSGLSSDFSTRYAVKWDGYLFIEKGVTAFELSCKDLAAVYINYYPIALYPEVHDYDSIQFDYEMVIYEKGLYPINIYYTKYKGGSGLNVKIKFENEEEYVDINPYLVYVPNGNFEYVYNTAVYTINEDIQSNNPILLVEDKTVFKYTSEPDLPSGLSIDEKSGIISGNPNVIQDQKEYKITVEFDDKSTIDVKINIKVNGDSTPIGFHFIDVKSGEELKSLEFTIGSYYDLLVSQISGIVIDLDVNNLPSDFIFDKVTQRLTGLCRSLIDGNVIEVIGTLIDGSTKSETFTMTSRYLCDRNNDVYHSVLIEGGYINDGTIILISSNNTRIEIPYKNGMDLLYVGIGCYLADNYSLIIKDDGNGYYNTKWTILADGETIFKVSSVQGLAEAKYEITSIPTKPEIHYPENDIMLYLNQENYVLIPSFGRTYVESCSIEPEFKINGLVFSKIDCSIKGKTLSSQDKKTYTITATNPFGSTTTNISVSISNMNIFDGCEYDGKVLLQIKRHIDGNQHRYMFFYIYDLNDLLIFSWIGGNDNNPKDKTYEICVPQNVYKFRIQNTDKINGWKNGFVKVSIYNMGLGNYTMMGYEETKSINYNLKYDIDINSEWSYNYHYKEGWNLPNQSDDWSKTKLNDLKSGDTNAVYLRMLKSFENVLDNTALYIRLSHISGIIFYINGIELYHKFINSNNVVTEDTKADNYFEKLTDIKFIIPIEILNETINSISIEIHKFESEESFPQIKLFLMQFEGDDNDKDGCSNINQFINKIESDSEDIVNYKIENAFDTLNSTIWRFRKMSNAIIKFEENTILYFNEIGIVKSGLSGSNNVKEMILSGKKSEEEEYKEISTFSNISYSDSKGIALYPNYNSYNKYNSLKLEISDPINVEIGVRDILFDLCPVRYCNEIIEYNISKTIIGSIININCIQPVDKEKILFCPKSKYPLWRELKNECEEKPKLLSSYENYTFEVGKQYNEVSLFSISGPKIVYSISKEIKGLIFDSSNGLISGIPYEEMSEKVITFKAKNLFDENGISIDIKVKVNKSEIPMFLYVNSTITLVAGIEIENMKLFIVIGEKLQFIIYDLPNGLYFDEEKRLLNGKAEEEGIFESRFEIKNEKGKDETSITITIVYPNKPIILKIENDLKLYNYEKYEKNIYPLKCVGRELKYKTYSKLPIEIELIEDTGELKGLINDKISNEYSINIICENVNGSMNANINIRIEESPYPILINYTEKVEMIVGNEYINLKIFDISGSNVTKYSLSSNLPNNLEFNNTNGLINGYVLKKYENMKYIMIISENDKSINFTFEIEYIKSEDAIIVESTIVKSHKFEGGKIIDGFKLFEVFGDNISIIVNPDLPKGIIFNNKNSIIYGMCSIKSVGKNYTFIIQNYPSTKEIIEIIYLEFESVLCESENGFEETVAIIGGNIVVIDCGILKNGYKSRSCLLTDSKAEWSIIIDNCEVNLGGVIAIVISILIILILIICIMIYMLLKSGKFRNRATSSVLIRQNKNDSINVENPIQI